MPRLRQVVSLLVLALAAVLALGSSMSKEEKEKFEKKKQENRDAVDAYVKTMGLVHAAVKKLDPGTMVPISCDGRALTKAIGDNAYANLHVVYAPFLERFARPEEKSAWTEDKSGWAWISDSLWRGHFEKHPSERDDYAVRSTGESMRDYLKRRYMIVVLADDKDSLVLPEVPKSGSDFESGLFMGWAVVFDQTDATIACQYPLDVENSEVVWTSEGGVFDESDRETIVADFQDNLEAALEKGLGEHGPGVLTGYGELLK